MTIVHTTQVEMVGITLSLFANSKPDNANDTNTKSKDESDQDQDIPIVIAQLESKELGETRKSISLFSHSDTYNARTSFTMTIAEISTGTP
jgi:hypothetical protein